MIVMTDVRPLTVPLKPLLKESVELRLTDKTGLNEWLTILIDIPGSQIHQVW